VDIEAVACVHNLQYRLLSKVKQSEYRRRPKPLCPSDIQIIKYVHLTNTNVSKVNIVNWLILQRSQADFVVFVMSISEWLLLVVDVYFIAPISHFRRMRGTTDDMHHWLFCNTFSPTSCCTVPRDVILSSNVLYSVSSSSLVYLPKGRF